jgi:hypothetical protein
MAFGLLFDIPLLLIPFILMVKFRKPLTSKISRIPLPKFALFLLVSIPLINFEEMINCGAYGCAPVLIVPTMPVILGFILLLGIFSRILKAKSTLRTTLVFSVLGFLFELIVGVASAQFIQLIWVSPPFFIFMAFWVGMSYAFISYLPLAVLLDENPKKRMRPKLTEKKFRSKR